MMWQIEYLEAAKKVLKKLYLSAQIIVISTRADSRYIKRLPNGKRSTTCSPHLSCYEKKRCALTHKSLSSHPIESFLSVKQSLFTKTIFS